MFCQACLEFKYFSKIFHLYIFKLKKCAISLEMLFKRRSFGWVKLAENVLPEVRSATLSHAIEHNLQQRTKSLKKLKLNKVRCFPTIKISPQ